MSEWRKPTWLESLKMSGIFLLHLSWWIFVIKMSVYYFTGRF